MPNQVERQISQEGQRNVIVKWTGVLDSDFTLTPALSPSDCVQNYPGYVLSGFQLRRAEWSISQQLEISLQWNASTPQLLLPLAGRGKINTKNFGGFTPDLTRPGRDGSLNLVSLNYPAGTTAAFVLSLELTKLYLPR